MEDSGAFLCIPMKTGVKSPPHLAPAAPLGSGSALIFTIEKGCWVASHHGKSARQCRTSSLEPLGLKCTTTVCITRRRAGSGGWFTMANGYLVTCCNDHHLHHPPAPAGSGGWFTIRFTVGNGYLATISYCNAGAESRATAIYNTTTRTPHCVSQREIRVTT